MRKRDEKGEVIIIEKRYGCYRAGVLFSLLLILILVIIICIPPIFSSFIDDNKELNTYLLIFLIFTFVVVGLVIVYFIQYQHKQAFKQRLQSENGIYTLQRQRLRRGESNAKTNVTELQRLKLDLNSNEKNVPIKK